MLRAQSLLIVLALLPWHASTTQAQPAADTLKPRVTPVGTAAFRSAASPDAAELQTQTLPAPAPFTDLLLRWDAPEGDDQLAFEVRVSDDGAHWSAWGALTRSDDLGSPDDRTDVAWSEPLYVGTARFFQLRLASAVSDRSSLPDGLEVHTVDADAVPASVQTPQPAAPDNATTNAQAPPSYVSRTAWGNPHGENAPDAPPRFRQATHLVVHHTAQANYLVPGEPDWAARVRATWSFHTYSRGWGDIGYNWLIDPNGVIYAGRAGSTRLDADAAGFHDTANHGSMGVSVLGTYSSVRPSTAAQESLIKLLTWKAGQRAIDPLDSSYYYGCDISRYCEPFNDGAVVPNIAGHRQVTPGHTECPGDAFMAIMPAIRQRVAESLLARTGARIRAVRLETPRINVGEIARVAITIQNTGSVAIPTQAPVSGGMTSTDGWVYLSDECFLGGGGAPVYDKRARRLRVTLGVGSSSQPIAGACSADHGGYPWRWGLHAPLQAGETRTIYAAVRFTKPGTYALRANLINEFVAYYGTDGRGAAINVGTLTVTPENTKAPRSTVRATLRSNGAIELRIESSASNIVATEILVRDRGDRSERVLRTTGRQIIFFGTPGRSYEFRSRASDGTNRESLPLQPDAVLSVPADASFSRVILPAARRSR